MSQNQITLPVNNVSVRILAGYDRPLQQVFCSMEPLSEDEAELDALPLELFELALKQFSNAEDIRTTVAAMGVTLPATFLAAVEEDVLCHNGNVIRMFSPEGTLLSSHGL